MTKGFAAAGCLMLVTGWAQQAPTPAHASGPAEFEVATVKPQKEPLQPGAFDLSWVGTAGKPFKIAGNRPRSTARFTVSSPTPTA